MHSHLNVKSLFVEPKISICLLQNTLPLNLIISQINPKLIITAYFSETHFNILGFKLSPCTEYTLHFNIIFLYAVFSTLFLPEFCIHSLCTHVCIQP